MSSQDMNVEQRHYAKKAKELLLLWKQRQNICVHLVEILAHYINMELEKAFIEAYGVSNTFATSLEVLIFYKTETELKTYKENGIVEKTKQEFMRILGEIGYITEFNDKVRFEFDSDENVKKNYKGNYFFRLR